MPSLPLKKRRAERQAGAAPLKPKLVLLGLGKTALPQTEPTVEELESALQQAQEQTGAAGAAIALGAGADLYCRASRGAAPPVNTRLDPESGLTGLCFRSGELLLCNNTEEDSRVDAEACRALGVRSVLVVPVRAEGITRGVLELLSAQAAAFDDVQVAAVKKIASGLLGRELGAAQEPTPVPEPRPRVETRLKAESHSPWSRTAIAAALIAAGVMGYDGKLKHAPRAPHPKPAIASSVAAPAAHVSIATADVARTEARIQGGFSSANLGATRARASGGDGNAAYELAEHYADGAGVQRDYEQAMTWFRQAAEKGNASAEWKLGLGYLKGVGVPEDDSQAAEWFRRAANQGHMGAQLALSELYFSGRGVPRDYVRAYTWGMIAAQTTNENTDSLQAIAAHLTPDELADAQHRVELWWQHRSSR